MKKCKQKLLSVLLAFSVLVSMVPMLTDVAAAEDVDLSGSTIVLSDGVAYQNEALPANNITDQVAGMGLSYDSGTSTWTMNNFTFTTTAETALTFTGTTPITVKVIGDNSVTPGTSSSFSTYGIRIDADTTFQGSGTLTVNGGSTSGIRTAYGLSAEKNVEIKGITLTINGGNASNSDSVALSLYSEDGATFTVNNATVVCSGGTASDSSTGIYNSGFAIAVTGTGKLTAAMGVGEDGGSSICGGSDPQLTAVDANGNALTWDANDETYKDAVGNAAATAVLTAAGPDYTIVLVGDKARKNGDAGDDVTGDVAAMGLTYAGGVWTMNNFNFTTTAGTALRIDSETTITVTGTNTITGGDRSDAYGLVIDEFANNVTLQGTGSLTVAAGNATGSEGYSSGILVFGNLTVQGITLTATSGNAWWAYGLENVGTFTVTDAVVNLTAGDASGTGSRSVGLYNDEPTANVVVTGTGKITAAAGSAGDTIAAIAGGTDPQLTAKDAGGNALTWNSTDATYKDAAGNAAATIIMKAVDAPDDPDEPDTPDTPDTPDKPDTPDEPTPAPTPDEPTPAPTPDEPAKPAAETGDGGVMLYLALACSAMLGGALLLGKRKEA